MGKKMSRAAPQVGAPAAPTTTAMSARFLRARERVQRARADARWIAFVEALPERKTS